jgi:predicted AAA+ superfamily ATPase
MSLFESEDSSGAVSLQELFQGNVPAAETDSHTLEDIAYLVCRGGWPKALGTSSEIALQQAIDYYDSVVYSDVNRVDQSDRDPEKVKRLLWSYARNDSSQCSLEKIRRDAIGSGKRTFDQNTLYSYLKALKKIFVLEDSPAWIPNLRSRTAVRTSDTRYFTDPSVAAAALGVGPEDLMNDLNTFGLLFENLCVRDLRVYADVLDGEVRHYRDKNGLECDAVLQRRNGTYALIEIKLGGVSFIEEGAANLLKLARNIDTGKMKAPSFLMVLCAKSGFAYQRKDGVIVCPITCLKP